MRAVVLHLDKLLLVNAWPGERSDLWCAPGGGVERGASLTDNLVREVVEETGLAIEVGSPCLVNEFHDPASGFHQVELFFRATLSPDATTPDGWRDPEGVVDRIAWVGQDEIASLRVKPDALRRIAWSGLPAGDVLPLAYDPLELLQH